MDKRKCDKCDRPATHHEVSIVKGQKIEKHLCDAHAAEEGLTLKVGHKPINELLTNFIKLHSGAPVKNEPVCPDCGLTFSEFQDKSLLGCAACYEAFAPALTQLLQRAHDGGDHHLGKIPRRAGSAATVNRQQQLLRMRKRLDEAVVAEDYELAAQLRDEVRKLEKDPR